MHSRPDRNSLSVLYHRRTPRPLQDTPGQMDVCLSEPEEAHQRAFGVDVLLFNEGRL